MIPIEQLIQPVSADTLFDNLLGALEVVGIPARSWPAGGVARSIVAALAQTGSQASIILADLIGGMFLFFAAGDYLTAHAEDVFGVVRIPATFATGQITIINTGGGVYGPFGPGEIIVRSSADLTKRFKVLDTITIGAGATLTGVNIEAVTAGSASTVAPGEIDELETTLNKVTVTNPASVIGNDAETDSALKTRCLAKRGTWSPLGPRDAYAYAALSATIGGVPTSITRVAVSRFSSTGQVTVVCATATGTPTSGELQAVRDNIEAIARPDTVTVTVLGAAPVSTVHALVVWCKGGNIDVVTQRVNAALEAYISTYPIGGISKVSGGPGFLWADGFAAVAIKASPEIFDVDFVPSAIDIPLTSSQVAVDTTTLDVRIL